MTVLHTKEIALFLLKEICLLQCIFPPNPKLYPANICTAVINGKALRIRLSDKPSHIRLSITPYQALCRQLRFSLSCVPTRSTYIWFNLGKKKWGGDTFWECMKLWLWGHPRIITWRRDFQSSSAPGKPRRKVCKRTTLQWIHSTCLQTHCMVVLKCHAMCAQPKGRCVGLCSHLCKPCSPSFLFHFWNCPLHHNLTFEHYLNLNGQNTMQNTMNPQLLNLEKQLQDKSKQSIFQCKWLISIQESHYWERWQRLLTKKIHFSTCLMNEHHNSSHFVMRTNVFCSNARVCTLSACWIWHWLLSATDTCGCISWQIQWRKCWNAHTSAAFPYFPFLCAMMGSICRVIEAKVVPMGMQLCCFCAHHEWSYRECVIQSRKWQKWPFRVPTDIENQDLHKEGPCNSGNESSSVVSVSWEISRSVAVSWQKTPRISVCYCVEFRLMPANKWISDQVANASL